MLLIHLPQIAVAEPPYGYLGFLLTKNKGFLQKDVSQILDVLRESAQTEGDNSF
jgi:hypothetical protein